MTTTTTTRPSRAAAPGAGEGAYREALDERTQQLLSQLVAGPYQDGPVPPVELMLGAARIVNEHGMPLRHAAARQAIACYAAEYLRHFAFEASSYAGDSQTAETPGLLWRVPAALLSASDATASEDEGVVLDVVRCIALDSPVVTAAARDRSVALLRAQLADPDLAGLPLLGVRLCVLGAPRQSVLLDPDGQLRMLTTTRLWGSAVRTAYFQPGDSDQHPVEVGARLPDASVRAQTARQAHSTARRSA